MKPIEAIAEIAPPQNPCPISKFKVDKLVSTNLHTPSKVEQEIKDIQKKAFDLGVETAQGVGNRKDRFAQAQVMDLRLTELHPLISCELPEIQQQLAITWSDARLDLAYVLSDGKELVRPQLYYYVQDLRKKNK